jgi:hypothetical protein
MSDLRLVTPYTLSRWLRLPIEDMLSELQLIVDTVSLGNWFGTACIIQKLADSKSRKERAIMVVWVDPPRRDALPADICLAPEGATPVIVRPRRSAGNEAGSVSKR